MSEHSRSNQSKSNQNSDPRPDHICDPANGCGSEIASNEGSAFMVLNSRSSRRIFLRHSALAMVGIGSAPIWLQRALYATDDRTSAASFPRKKILVTIFQRGAADGLNIVVPHGEKRYYDLRPSISVPRPSGKVAEEDAVIDLDGMFGLNPSLAALKPIYNSGHLAIVHAVGSPDPTRSHFDAQDYMESGTPGGKSIDSGWLNRVLVPEQAIAGRMPNSTPNGIPHGAISPVRAVSMGPNLPRALRGPESAVAIENLNSFKVQNDAASMMLKSLYKSTGDQVLNGTGKETFDAVSMLQSLAAKPYQPLNGANYPGGRFGDSLRQIAQLVKADVGLEVAFTDIGGWDHHVNEVGPKASVGQLPQRLKEFGQGLAAFWNDLGDHAADVVVVTMSEFGRTAKENGDRGTDHGHANVMFVMGGPVRGGKVYGEWPGLGEHQLYEGRDLNLTTDFRDVLGEAVLRHLGNRSLSTVFPGYAQNPAKFKGFLKA